MTRLVRTVSDRLLAALVPTSTAGACVPNHGDTVYWGCYCYDGRHYRQRCTVQCSGSLSCGTCYRTQNAC